MTILTYWILAIMAITMLTLIMLDEDENLF